MKRLTIAALIAAQILAAQPAFAAGLAAAEEQRAGAFGGFRLRVPLDAVRGDRRVRAGLAIAPALRGRTADGETRLLIGEGLELDFAGRAPRLLVAGLDVRRVAAQGDENEEEDGGGPSTLGWIAIGVGVTAVIIVGAAAICLSDSDCIPSE